jgi:hypothetical protein
VSAGCNYDKLLKESLIVIARSKATKQSTIHAEKLVNDIKNEAWIASLRSQRRGGLCLFSRPLVKRCPGPDLPFEFCDFLFQHQLLSLQLGQAHRVGVMQSFLFNFGIETTVFLLKFNEMGFQ